jgi:hypothetical protein
MDAFPRCRGATPIDVKLDLFGEKGRIGGFHVEAIPANFVPGPSH